MAHGHSSSLATNSTRFIESECLLSYSPQPATANFLESDESSRRPHNLFHNILFASALCSHLCLDLPVILFPSFYPTSILFFIASPIAQRALTTCQCVRTVPLQHRQYSTALLKINATACDSSRFVKVVQFESGVRHVVTTVCCTGLSA